MGTTRSIEQFSHKIVEAGDVLRKRQRDIVTAGAQVTKESFLAAAAARGVKPGGKIAGKPWSVRYAIQTGAETTATVRFVGPFHLVDRPTRPHPIATRTGRRGRRSRTGAKALSLADGTYRAVVEHPGTRGKRIFDAAKVLAGRSAPKAMEAKVRSILVETLR
jgi:hypothetical protein